ncbi:BTAD domain-containing putative transcriptional regulator [Catenuloplanes sp. NPDC051500]|uniref:AfsR/SARP family transcriptional regulator n=1 Tax=Catenuloplanes sp. NPDC051500 TaxID=3363959 RepID=UPI00378B8CDF
MSVRISLLGPVRLWRDSDELPVGSPQQQAVLAALTLSEGQPTSVEQLFRVLWGDDSPSSAISTMRSYLSRLRRLLRGTTAEIVTSGDGYALRGEDVSVDVWELRSAADQASVLIRDRSWEQAETLLHPVLESWQGPALNGVGGDWAERQRTRLAEARTSALESLISARLRIGVPSAQDLAELTRLVEAQPLHENLRALLMRTLHRRGRRSEALQTYESGYRMLRDELGLEPGPGLRDAHASVLRDDSSAVTREPVAAKGAVYLPPDPADFVGRTAELAALQNSLDGRSPAVGVAGMPGSGRSSLAIRAAHRLADRFPAGRIYHDLEKGDVEDVLLRLLGDAQDVPRNPAAKTAELLRLTSGRRLLLVLDNVRDAEQLHRLRLMLPDAALIFTTTRRLHSLPGVDWIRLGPLDPSECLALFVAVAGQARIGGDLLGARRLANLTGGYAFAARIFAQRVHAHPNWSITAIADQMANEMANPYPADHGDCHTLAAPVLRAHDLLPRGAARVFRALGVMPADQVSASMVAALLGMQEHQAFFALEALADALLVCEGTDEQTYRLIGPVIATVAMRAAYAVDGEMAVEVLRRACAAPAGTAA